MRVNLVGPEDIAVITPYFAQARKIRLLLKQAGIEGIMVCSVELIQGQVRPHLPQCQLSYHINVRLFVGAARHHRVYRSEQPRFALLRREIHPWFCRKSAPIQWYVSVFPGIARHALVVWS